MAFTDIVKDGSHIYDLLVTIGSYTFSYNGVLYNDVYYDDRIISVGQIRRIADIAAFKFDIPSFEIVLSNDTDNPEDTTSQFATAISSGAFINSDVTVQAYVEDYSGNIDVKTLYVGLSTLRSWDRSRLTLDIRPIIFDRLGPLQRMITKVRFPAANDKYFGTGIPINFGGPYDTLDAKNWIELPQIDTTNYYLAVRQGVLRKTSPNTVDVYYLTQAGGGTPTSTGSLTLTNDTDAFGDSFVRCTVDPGDWDADYRYMTPALPLIEDNDHPWYLVEDIQNNIVLNAQTLSPDDVDYDKFTTVAELLTDVFGYDSTPFAGFPIPESGAPSMESRDTKTAGWEILQEMARTMGISLYITAEGKIAPVVLAPWPLIDIDTSTTIATPDPVAYYRRQDDNITELRISEAPFGIVSDLRASAWRTPTNVNGNDGERYKNDDVESRYGEFIDEITIKGINKYGLMLTGENTAGRLAATWYMYLRSGAYKALEIEVPTLEGLIPDIGDRIVISDSRTVGIDQEVLVTGILFDPNPQRPNCMIYGVNVTDPYGTLDISTTSTTASFYPTLDTYVDSDNPTTSYGTATTFSHGGNSGGSIYKRAGMRFDLSSLDALGATVTAATLTLYVVSLADASQTQIRQLGSTTWSTSSTFNAFDGSGAWNESNIGGTQLANAIVSNSLGFRTHTLNASGLTYLNSVIGGTNLIELTFQAMNNDEEYSFASIQNGNVAFWPKLEVTYTV